jgi:ADP-heptose:LPS heptosyltransferase
VALSRALVLRALGLGDFLTGVPALRALRRALPGHELSLAAPGVLRPLVRLSGTVDRLLPTAELAAVEWPGAGPDIAVNLHGSGPQSHRLLRATGPARLVAFGSEEAGVPGPCWDDGEHERDRWCRLVTTAFDVPADPDDLLLDVPAAAPAPASDGAVLIHPGAAYGSRRWPPQRFAQIARWAAGRGWRVVVTGTPDEAGLATEVQQRAGLPPESVLAGRTDLEQLAALVAAARLVVCGDTGVAHLASAYRTPSVVLFGPTPPGRWGPPASGPHAVLWHGTGPTDPFGDSPDPALLEIGVAEVLDRAEALTSTRDGA